MAGVLRSLLCCFNGPTDIATSYHPRFGSTDITAPNTGGFSSATPMVVSIPIPKDMRNGDTTRRALDPTTRFKTFAQISPTFSHVSHPDTASHANTTNTSPPISPWSTDSIPVHEAFIPSNRHTMRTISIPSPTTNSPPASPPLLTPSSFKDSGSTNGAHQQHMLPRNGSVPALQHTISAHHELDRLRAPTQVTVTVDEKDSLVTTPTKEMVEQWPGTM